MLCSSATPANGPTGGGPGRSRPVKSGDSTSPKSVAVWARADLRGGGGVGAIRDIVTSGGTRPPAPAPHGGAAPGMSRQRLCRPGASGRAILFLLPSVTPIRLPGRPCPRQFDGPPRRIPSYGDHRCNLPIVVAGG